MKRSTTLALAGVMTVFLTACGGESPKPAPTVKHPMMERRMNSEEAAPAPAAAPAETTPGPQASNDMGAGVEMNEAPATDDSQAPAGDAAPAQP